jgi:hypothetical protein
MSYLAKKSWVAPNSKGWSLNFDSLNNLASTYSINLFSHSSSISNPKEWLLPAHFLPVSLLLLLFLPPPPHPFPRVHIHVARHSSMPLLSRISRSRWVLRFGWFLVYLTNNTESLMKAIFLRKTHKHIEVHMHM